MKGVEMFGCVFTVGRVVVTLASVATAIGAYGFYELYRRHNPRKKKVDVSDVIDRHFCNGHMHQSRDREVNTNAPEMFSSTTSKADSTSKIYRGEPDLGNNAELIKNCSTGDFVASNAEIPNEEVSTGMLDGIKMERLVDGFRELVENRVSVLRSIGNDEDEWGVKAVDFYDELQHLVDSSSEEERHVLDAILSRIESELDAKGFVRIKLSEWNPEFQNAVVVTQGECAEGIKVIDTISSGVKRNGQILRKQEVSILTSKRRTENE